MANKETEPYPQLHTLLAVVVLFQTVGETR